MTRYDPTPYAVLDIESDGVEDTAMPWEIAVLTYEEGDWRETVIQISDYDRQMSVEAEAVNHFSQRYGRAQVHAQDADATWWAVRETAAAALTQTLSGKMLVGANVWKDARWLENLGAAGWHYRMTDLGSMFLGAYGYRPGGQWAIAEALDIAQPEAAQHTALGDARVARDIFEHIMLDRR